MRIRSILIVDDELGFRDLLRFLLEPLGFEVIEARDGQEAMERFAERSFDLVLLDIHMPRLVGPEVRARMRAICPGQQILMISGSSEQGSTLGPPLAEARTSGHLQKPLELDSLIDAIQRAVRREPEGDT